MWTGCPQTTSTNVGVMPWSSPRVTWGLSKSLPTSVNKVAQLSLHRLQLQQMKLMNTLPSPQKLGHTQPLEWKHLCICVNAYRHIGIQASNQLAKSVRNSIRSKKIRTIHSMVKTMTNVTSNALSKAGENVGLRGAPGLNKSEIQRSHRPFKSLASPAPTTHLPGLKI